MRRSRFSDEQIIAIFQEAERSVRTGEVVRRHGVSRQPFYLWHRQFGGMQVPEAKRLRTLEEENQRLKRVAAD